VPSFQKARRLLRIVPTAYVLGALVLVVGSALLATSLLSYVVAVGSVSAEGEAPPGTAEADLPFDATSFFRATLTIQSCDVAFHLLTDAEYARFLANGQLSMPNLDCHRTQALIRSPIRHLVTVNRAEPSTSNVSYSITATLFAEHHPYALLAFPGAFLSLGAVIWIGITAMNRGTEKLIAEFRGRSQDKRK